MTLFESDSQYRERATLWRIFSLLPLFANLSLGKMWRWFAVNVPMDLGTGGSFTSDVDILAKLSNMPKENSWSYYALEVKVSLLHNDGSASSLKAGKTKRTVTQLEAYRDFGIPVVSLLDVQICETGFFHRIRAFPTKEMLKPIETKFDRLRAAGFGYQLLPFEHQTKDGRDVGLSAISTSDVPPKTWMNLLTPRVTQAKHPFSKWSNTLSEFFESCPDYLRKHFMQIVYCKACRSLQLIDMRMSFECPDCGDDMYYQG